VGLCRNREGASLDFLFILDRIGTGPGREDDYFATATRLSAALLRAGFSAAIAMGMRVHAGIAGVCPPAATCAGAVASCAFNIFGFWRNAMRASRMILAADLGSVSGPRAARSR